MLPSMKWMKFIAYISSCMTGSELLRMANQQHQPKPTDLKFDSGLIFEQLAMIA